MTAPPTALPNLTIDADRLWADIMATAAFGGTEKDGRIGCPQRAF